MQEELCVTAKWDLSQDCKVGLTFKIIIIHCINRQKRKGHMTTPRVGKKHLTNIILIHGKKRKKKKKSWQTGVEEARLGPTEGVCESPSLTAQRGPKTGRHCPEAAARRGHPPSPLWFSVVLET